MHGQQKGAPKVLFYFFKHFGFGEILIYSEPQEQIRQLRSAVLVLWGVEGSGTKVMRGLLKLISGFGKRDSLECVPQEIGGREASVGLYHPQEHPSSGGPAEGHVCSLEETVGETAADSRHVTAAPSWDFPMATITQQRAT